MMRVEVVLKQLQKVKHTYNDNAKRRKIKKQKRYLK